MGRILKEVYSLAQPSRLCFSAGSTDGTAATCVAKVTMESNIKHVSDPSRGMGGPPIFPRTRAGRPCHKRASLLSCIIVALVGGLPASRAEEPSPPPASRPSAAAGMAATAVPDTVVVDRETEEVLKGALNYLASKQTASGSWTGPGGQFPIALTGYSLVAFMATGNQPGEGQYGKSLTNAVQFLLNCVHEDGFIGGPYPNTNMYEHGIATTALAEVYGQTRNPALRPKLASAVRLILKCQNQLGGWRYPPVMADADISVTVIQVVALRAAKNSGIDVPQPTIDKAIAYVRSCHDPSGGFTYQPGNHQPGFARTAAAVYSLQVCGAYDDPLIKPASDYLFAHVDERTQYFTYGNNYAAPAQYMIGGDTWKNWYAKIRNLLIHRVRREGPLTYWEGIDHMVNSVYATSVYTTILAMPYHYIPLYQR